MARLLLFAAIREAAGTNKADIPGNTIDEVIAQASQRFGAEFEALLPYCKTYVRGEPVTDNAHLAPDDELALLPPVSGGCA